MPKAPSQARKASTRPVKKAARRRTEARTPGRRAAPPRRRREDRRAARQPAQGGQGNRTPQLTPCLWFDKNAEEAARFYVATFPGSRIDGVAKSPADYPSGRKGDVLAVEFTLMGRRFSALNGGPYFKFNEAVSFQVPCKDQAEVDRYWSALSAVPASEQCGWVKDRFGLSWQIVPDMLPLLLADPDRAKAGRVMEAMLKMKKLDIAALERAARA